MRIFNIAFFILFFQANVQSAHIVGGDFFYTCLGGDQYEVVLKVYKDCFSTGANVADFDMPANIGIFDQNNVLENVLNVNLLSRSIIPPLPSNPCFQAPANVCVEEGVYRFIVTLPNGTGTHTIVYQRCCRNGTIVNIIAPGATGATYTLQINTNPPFNCNNSPEFNEFPPIVICSNEPLIFDHSASDIDGDSLVYELCTPNVGADQTVPMPAVPSDPPYTSLAWRAGFSNNLQVSSQPNVSIDPITGLITGTPNQSGQYVVGVCVKEYRNGILIGEVRRDFQFNVTPCLSGVEAIIPTLNEPDPLAAGTAGLFQRECNDFTVNFVNESQFGTFYLWDFGVPGTNTDTSTLFEPSFTYPDTGAYFVTLIVNPGFTCSDTTVVLVRIFPIFRANFDFVEQCEGTAISFTDLTTSSFNDVAEWQWDFGDGNFSSLQNPQHNYAQAGQFLVTLASASAKQCRDTISKAVVLHPFPLADFNNSPACINTPVNFYDNSTIDFGNVTNYTWLSNNNVLSSDSSFIQTFSNLQNFSLTLIVSNDFGCADTVVRPIQLFPLPTVSIINDTSACVGDTLQLFASGGVRYDWTSDGGDILNDQQRPIIIADFTKTFEVRVTDANQCENNASVLVEVFDIPGADAGADTFVCAGNTIQLNGSGERSISFLWSPNQFLNNANISNPTASINDTTIFVLQTTNPEGCSNYDSVLVYVQNPIVSGVANDTFICFNDTIALNASGGFFYQWIPSENLSNDTIAQPLAFPKATTTYVVIISNQCFSDTVDVTVEVFPLPIVNAGNNDSIFRGETTTLTGSGGIDFLWQPGIDLADSLAAITQARPFNTTEFVLTVTDVNGCKNKDSVIVFVDASTLILVPNAFTPNNDKANDVFRIVKLLNIDKVLTFKIFNRWGQLLFETDDKDQGWDGNFKGEPQPIEVYHFYIKAITYDGDEVLKKGNLTLLR